MITDDTIVIHSPFDARELVKQIPGRRWDPDRKVWTVPEIFESEARSILSSWLGRVVYDDRRQPVKTPPKAQMWADTMFDALPAVLRQPVYRALSRVLHPDSGGDTKAMQQLNAAWQRHERKPA